MLSTAIGATAPSKTSRGGRVSPPATRSSGACGQFRPAGSITTVTAIWICSSNYVSWEVGADDCLDRGKPYYCHPRVYKPLPNQLFHNNRNGTFTDVSEASGIRR